MPNNDPFATLNDDLRQEDAFASFNQSLRQPTPKPETAEQHSAFVRSAKSAVGSAIKSTGTALEDVGIPALGKPMQEYGQEVVEANPSEIKSAGDLFRKPWQAVQEGVGQMVAQVPMTIAGAAGGRLVGGALGGLVGGPIGAGIGQTIGGAIGGFAPNYVQEYGQARDIQKEQGLPEDIKGAAVKSLAPAALEYAGDVLAAGKLIPGVGRTLGAGALAEGATIGQRVAHVGKEALKGAAIEGPLTETPQTYMENWAAGAPVFTPETHEQAIIGGALGAIGGGVIRGGSEAISPTRAQPEQNNAVPQLAVQPQPAAVPPLGGQAPQPVTAPAMPQVGSQFTRPDRAETFTVARVDPKSGSVILEYTDGNKTKTIPVNRFAERGFVPVGKQPQQAPADEPMAAPVQVDTETGEITPIPRTQLTGSALSTPSSVRQPIAPQPNSPLSNAVNSAPEAVSHVQAQEAEKAAAAQKPKTLAEKRAQLQAEKQNAAQPQVLGDGVAMGAQNAGAQNQMPPALQTDANQNADVIAEKQNAGLSESMAEAASVQPQAKNQNDALARAQANEARPQVEDAPVGSLDDLAVTEEQPTTLAERRDQLRATQYPEMRTAGEQPRKALYGAAPDVGAFETKEPEKTEEPAQPWMNATDADETRWFGSRIEKQPRLKGEKPWEGTVRRVIKGMAGPILEVQPDGLDTTFRVTPEELKVLSVQDSAEQQAAAQPVIEPRVMSAEEDGKPKLSGRYAEKADGTMEQQKRWAARGSRVSLLAQLNDVVGAYSRDDLDRIPDSDIESVRDYLMSEYNKRKQPQETPTNEEANQETGQAASSTETLLGDQGAAPAVPAPSAVRFEDADNNTFHAIGNADEIQARLKSAGLPVGSRLDDNTVRLNRMVRDKAVSVFAQDGEQSAKPERASSREWVNEGKTEADKTLERTDSLGRDFAQIVHEESSSGDFAPNEVPVGIRQWATEHNVPVDDLRQSILRHMDASQLSPGRKAQVRAALDPTRPNSPWQKANEQATNQLQAPANAEGMPEQPGAGVPVAPALEPDRAAEVLQQEGGVEAGAEKEPWQMRREEWNAQDRRTLADDEVAKLTRKREAQTALVNVAKLGDADVYQDRNDDGVPTSPWQELIPTGRQPLSQEDHRNTVIQAIAQGKPVPADVLADYPDLAKSAQPNNNTPPASDASATRVVTHPSWVPEAKRPFLDKALNESRDFDAFKRRANALLKKINEQHLSDEQYGDLRSLWDQREIDKAAHSAATSPQNEIPQPTDAQKKAGNYQKGHTRIQGMDVSIENPRGSVRSGTDADGRSWQTEMAHHYGYVKGTRGADGDQVDVFVGPNPSSEKVFVVNQIDPKTGKFDEHKAMLGFDDEESARQGYLSNYEQGWQGAQSITPMSVGEFKSRLDNHEFKKSRPAKDAKEPIVDTTPVPSVDELLGGGVVEQSPEEQAQAEPVQQPADAKYPWNPEHGTYAPSLSGNERNGYTVFGNDYDPQVRADWAREQISALKGENAVRYKTAATAQNTGTQWELKARRSSKMADVRDTKLRIAAWEKELADATKLQRKGPVAPATKPAPAMDDSSQQQGNVAADGDETLSARQGEVPQTGQLESAPEATAATHETARAKEAWEMTRKEYAQQGGEIRNSAPREANTHRDQVEDAFKRGENVPDDVLKEYPWLAADKVLKPYVAGLKDLSDQELKAEEKESSRQLNEFAKNTPVFLTDGRMNPEARGTQAYFEISNKFNAINREIDRRKSEAPTEESYADEMKRRTDEQYKGWKGREQTTEQRPDPTLRQAYADMASVQRGGAYTAGIQKQQDTRILRGLQERGLSKSEAGRVLDSAKSERSQERNTTMATLQQRHLDAALVRNGLVEKEIEQPATDQGMADHIQGLRNQNESDNALDDSIGWDAATPEQREAMAATAGWTAGKDNHVSPLGRKIAQRAWADMPGTTKQRLASKNQKATQPREEAVAPSGTTGQDNAQTQIQNEQTGNAPQRGGISVVQGGVASESERSDNATVNGGQAKKPKSAIDAAFENLGVPVPSDDQLRIRALRKQAEKLANEAHGMLSGMEAGQPVLSTRDSNLREKSAEKMRKAAEIFKQADELEAKIASSAVTPAAEGAAVESAEADTWQQANREAARIAPTVHKVKSAEQNQPNVQQMSKEAWQMTADEYATQKIENGPYSEAYLADKELYEDRKSDLIQEWNDKLDARAKEGRIDDVALDDYVARYGIAGLQRNFRGQLEKGTEGYQPKDVRDEKVAFHQPTASEKPEYARTWAEYRATVEADHFKDGAAKTPAYWEQLRKQHRTAIVHAEMAGRTIPDDVKADYPDLFGGGKKAQAETTEPPVEQSRKSEPEIKNGKVIVLTKVEMTGLQKTGKLVTRDANYFDEYEPAPEAKAMVYSRDYGRLEQAKEFAKKEGYDVHVMDDSDDVLEQARQRAMDNYANPAKGEAKTKAKRTTEQVDAHGVKRQVEMSEKEQARLEKNLALVESDEFQKLGRTRTINSLATHKEAIEDLYEGRATPESLRANYGSFDANRAEIEAELNAMKKPELLKRAGMMARSTDKKSDLVSSVMSRLEMEYVPSSGLSYDPFKKDGRKSAILKALESATPETLREYAEKIQQQRAEYTERRNAMLKAVQNPETLAEFRQFIEYRGKDKLTDEQRAKYEDLAAADAKAKSEAERAKAATVKGVQANTESQIIETKHTKQGHDLFVVQMADRVERDVYNELNAAAKKLGGYYSSFRGAGAVPGFQFRTREAAEQFQAVLRGEEVNRAEQVEEKVQQTEQKAAARLRSLADALEEKATEKLNADRKTNTVKRAREAGHAEEAARKDIALARTMRNIAEAMASGDVTLLDGIRHRVDVEMLNGMVNTAKGEEIRKTSDNYAAQERRKGEPATADTAKYATFPEYTVEVGDLRSATGKLDGKPGTKLLVQKLRKIADEQENAEYEDAVRANPDYFNSAMRKDSGKSMVFGTERDASLAIARAADAIKPHLTVVRLDAGKYIVVPSREKAIEAKRFQPVKSLDRFTIPDQTAEELITKAEEHGVDIGWSLPDKYSRRKHLARMGINSAEQLRAALREFIQYRGEKPKADKAKELERALVGKNVGVDFFPTPKALAADMTERAGVTEGMRVLEPSAGNGNIAEALRDAGGKVDVVEWSNDLREVLKEKGFDVVGSDFMDVTDGGYDAIVMNPPFSNNQDITHVQHAYDLLKPGGRLVAIVGEGAFSRQGKTETAFRGWLDDVGASVEKLPEGTFNDKSLLNTTGANARLVEVEKANDQTETPDETVRATVPAAPANESAAVEKGGEKKGAEGAVGEIDSRRQAIEAKIAAAVAGSKFVKASFTKTYMGNPTAPIEGQAFKGLIVYADGKSTDKRYSVGVINSHADILRDFRSITDAKKAAVRLAIAAPFDEMTDASQFGDANFALARDIGLAIKRNNMDPLAFANEEEINPTQAAEPVVEPPFGMSRDEYITDTSTPYKGDKIKVKFAGDEREYKEDFYGGKQMLKDGTVMVDIHGTKYLKPGTNPGEYTVIPNKYERGRRWDYEAQQSGYKEAERVEAKDEAQAEVQAKAPAETGPTGDRFEKLREQYRTEGDNTPGVTAFTKVFKHGDEHAGDVWGRWGQYLDSIQAVDRMDANALGQWMEKQLPTVARNLSKLSEPRSYMSAGSVYESTYKVRRILSDFETASQKESERIENVSKQIKDVEDLLGETEKTQSAWKILREEGAMLAGRQSQLEQELQVAEKHEKEAEAEKEAAYRDQFQPFDAANLPKLTPSAIGMTKTSAGWRRMEQDGKTIGWTLWGHVALFRTEDAPKGVENFPEPVRPVIENAQRFIATIKPKDTSGDLEPVALWNIPRSKDHAGTNSVILSDSNGNAAAVNAFYYQMIKKQIPSATFRASESVTKIYDGGKLVGVFALMKLGSKDIETALSVAKGAKESRSHTKPSAPTHSPTTLRSALPRALAPISKTLGANLLASPWFHIVTSDSMPGVRFGSHKAEMKYSKNGDILGYFDPATKQTYLVADNIQEAMSDADLRGLVLHEIGVHATQLGRDSKEFKAILREFTGLEKSGDKAVRAAFKRAMRADVPHALLSEEALGYFVQAHPDMPLAKRVVAWLREQLRALGRALPGLRGAQFVEWANRLTTDDLVYMARSALVESARSRAYVASSKGPLGGFAPIINTLAKVGNTMGAHEMKDEAAGVRGADLPLPFSPDDAKPIQDILFAEDSKDQTDTPEFKAWFGDSKVVDGDGRPLVVYHGTPTPGFSVFSHEKKNANTGGEDGSREFHFTDNPDYADAYSGSGAFIAAEHYLKHFGTEPKAIERMPSAIMPVFLSLQNPIYLAQSKEITADVIAKAKSDGHDGIIVAKAGLNAREFVVFENTQIKSAIGNSGAFSPTNPDIRFASADQTDSAAFKQWFGASKIRSNGAPEIVYHGSNQAIEAFDKSKLHNAKDGASISSLGFFFARDGGEAREYAQRAAKRDGGRAQTQGYYVSVENPYVVTSDLLDARMGNMTAAEFRAKLQAKGFDGVYIKDARYVVAFEPTQVKSIDNRGTWDGSDERVRYSLTDTAATIAPKAQEAVVDLFRSDRTFNRVLGFFSTQFHKAWVAPEFKPVFTHAMNFMNDVSKYSMQSEGLAPDVLLRMESVKEIFKTGATGKDMEKVGAALYAGTLENGPSPTNGVIWTDDELRTKFGMDDKQIDYYRQVRAAVNDSIDTVASGQMIREARTLGFALKMQRRLYDVATNYRNVVSTAIATEKQNLANATNAKQARMAKERIHALNEAMNGIATIEDQANALKNGGYFPLMRFGQYAVTMRDAGDDVEWFSMHETQFEANRKARELRQSFPDMTVSQSMMSEDAWKMFKGVSPETVGLFAKAVDLEKDPLMQEYLKLVVASRSALKRHIHREGMAGFSEDARRTLAQFIMSNSRYASSAVHMGPMVEATDAIRAGDVKDEAVKLYQYITDPQEEAAALRGFMFVNFLGGSVASGMVNATQPLLMTYPFLHQYSKNAGSALLGAAKEAATGKPNSDVKAAFDRATDEGILAPHEIHQLMASARGAKGSNLAWSRFAKVWGSLFSMAEMWNRRITFVAAYRIAQADPKLGDAYDFAVNAVHDTQGIYTKANRPNAARGTIGATVMTFKQYSIAYLEFIKRLPPKERALAMAILIMSAGLEGLPFLDDLDDLIDTIGQWMGFGTMSKDAQRRFVRKTLSTIGMEGMADFALHGASAYLPIDVSMRMGLQNLIPATAMFKPSEMNRGRESLEALGPLGGMVDSASQAIERLAKGDTYGAAQSIAPTAIRNAMKGFEMLSTGQYTDKRGRLVDKATVMQGVYKALGFNPDEHAGRSRDLNTAFEQIALQRYRESEFVESIIDARLRGDADAVAKVMRDVQLWNQQNPELPIRINLGAVRNRLMAAKMTQQQRFIKATPPEMRARVMQSMQNREGGETE